MKVTISSIMKLLIFIMLIYQLPGFSQNMVEANPANIYNPEAAFVNPAIILAQGRQVFTGIRLLQMGFIDNNSTAFKHSMLSYSQPFSVFLPKFGYGFNAQFLSTPWFSKGNYSFVVAKKITDILTIGGKGSVFTIGYDLSDANLENPIDPVFEKGMKISFSSGVGILIGPVSNLTVGMSVDHLNRPTVNLTGNDLRQPITFDFGIHYMYGAFGPSFNVNHQDYLTVTTFGFETQSQRIGRAGIFYGNKSVILDGKLFLMNGKMAVGYRMDLSLDSELISYSAGQHLVSLTYQFSEPIDADFKVISTTDYVNCVEKRLTIIADQGLSLDNIKDLQRYKLDLFDRRSVDALIDSAEVYNGLTYENSGGAELDEESLNYYKRAILDKIQQSGNKNFKVNVTAPPGGGTRALAFFNFLVKDLGIPAQNVNLVFAQDYTAPNADFTTPILEAFKTAIMAQNQNTLLKRVKIPIENQQVFTPKEAVFKIVRMRKSKPVLAWRLVIEKDKKIVRKIPALREPPPEVSWDWRDDDNKLISPGEYSYYFQWKDNMAGSWKPDSPRKRSLIVDKEIQTDSILLTKDGTMPTNGGQVDAEGFDIILNKNVDVQASK